MTRSVVEFYNASVFITVAVLRFCKVWHTGVYIMQNTNASRVEKKLIILEKPQPTCFFCFVSFFKVFRVFFLGGGGFFGIFGIIDLKIISFINMNNFTLCTP